MQPQLLQAFKELATFLGRKLDRLIEVGQDGKVMFDTGKSTQNLAKVAEKLEALTDAVAKNEPSRDLKGVKDAIGLAATSLLASARVIQNLKLDTSDFKATNKLVADLIKATKAIKLEQKPIDLSDLKTLIKCVEKLQSAIEKKDNSRLENLMERLIAAFNGFKVEIPKEFKLDEMQARTLAYSHSGIRPTENATRVTLTNLALTATNTQYTHTFAANTVSFRIKLRDQGTLTYYSYTTGTLPTVGGGGDGSKYMTIPQNFLLSQSNVEWSGKTMYFGSESATQVLEIEEFSM